MKVDMPDIGTYGRGSYGRWARIAGLTVWFSYRTPVAFSTMTGGLVIRENDWNTTTGCHLNAIDSDKSKRVSGAEFEAALTAELERREAPRCFGPQSAGCPSSEWD